MGCPKLPSTAANRADDHGQGHLPIEHVMHFCCLIDNMIHCREGKVDCHQFGNRAQSPHRCANGSPNNCRFCNGGVPYPFRSKVIVKSLGHGICSAPNPHFLSQDEDLGIAFHFLPQCLGDGFPHGNFCHVFLPIPQHRCA